MIRSPTTHPLFFFFFFNHPAPTEIYTLSLHDALPISFSTQAAYAAPLILLAQTRQASRDKALGERLEQHREKAQLHGERRVALLKQETDKLAALLQANTDLTRQDKDLTEQVAGLTREIHALLTKQD